MKKIISLVLGLTAVALAAGCSSDDSSDDKSCNMQLGGANFVCLTGPMTEAECTDGGAGVIVDSCPTGSIDTCKASSGGDSGTIYFYTDAAVTAMSSVCDA